ncbi:hypothetical protein [Halodesulfovibrio sp.]|jgi:hypothetical protein|uniref:hypothetical protein n=1 Tax=Halodesulfovibrio sp. TaxID=1912772 RepID=UPI0025F483D4|nr:hypothetical protein [Halodesulfovibrio sp.]MCT4626011.1 hypothetical protein [Halodesulfovibrio sp.]
MNTYGYDNDNGYRPEIAPEYPQMFQAPAGFPNKSGASIPNGQIILVGLAAICKAVGAGPSTIKKWIREEDFPVRKCSDGIYRASPESIRDWFAMSRPHKM